MTWVFFATTIICSIGWLRAALAGRAACVLLSQNGIRPTEEEIRSASRAAVRRLFSCRK